MVAKYPDDVRGRIYWVGDRTGGVPRAFYHADPGLIDAIAETEESTGFKVVGIRLVRKDERAGLLNKDVEFLLGAKE